MAAGSGSKASQARGSVFHFHGETIRKLGRRKAGFQLASGPNQRARLAGSGRPDCRRQRHRSEDPGGVFATGVVNGAPSVAESASEEALTLMKRERAEGGRDSHWFFSDAEGMPGKYKRPFSRCAEKRSNRTWPLGWRRRTLNAEPRARSGAGGGRQTLGPRNGGYHHLPGGRPNSTRPKLLACQF